MDKLSLIEVPVEGVELKSSTINKNKLDKGEYFQLTQVLNKLFLVV